MINKVNRSFQYRKIPIERNHLFKKYIIFECAILRVELNIEYSMIILILINNIQNWFSIEWLRNFLFLKRDGLGRKRETSLFPVVNVLFNYSNNNRHHRSNNNHHNHHNDKNNNNNGSARAMPCRELRLRNRLLTWLYVVMYVWVRFTLSLLLATTLFSLEAYNKPTSYSIKRNLARWFRFLIHAPWWLSVCLYVTVDVPRVYVWACLYTCVRDIQVSIAKRDDLRDAHERALAYVQIVNYNYNYIVLSVGFNGGHAFITSYCVISCKY